MLFGPACALVRQTWVKWALPLSSCVISEILCGLSELQSSPTPRVKEDGLNEILHLKHLTWVKHAKQTLPKW